MCAKNSPAECNLMWSKLRKGRFLLIGTSSHLSFSFFCSGIDADVQNARLDIIREFVLFGEQKNDLRENLGPSRTKKKACESY